MGRLGHDCVFGEVADGFFGFLRAKGFTKGIASGESLDFALEGGDFFDEEEL